MARQVFQLGAPTSDSPNVDMVWEAEDGYGRINAALVNQGVESYLRRIRVQKLGHFQIRAASSTTEDPTDAGPEFTELWEAADEAIVLSVGNLTLTIPGPE